MCHRTWHSRQARNSPSPFEEKELPTRAYIAAMLLRTPSLALLACLAFIGCAPEPAGESEGVESSDQDFSSRESVQLDFELDGELTSDSSWNPKPSIQDQFLYTIGHLNFDRSVGRLDRLVLTNIQTTGSAGAYHTRARHRPDRHRQDAHRAPTPPRRAPPAAACASPTDCATRRALAPPRLAHATNRRISSTLRTSPSHAPSPAPRPFSHVLASDALLSALRSPLSAREDAEGAEVRGDAEHGGRTGRDRAQVVAALVDHDAARRPRARITRVDDEQRALVFLAPDGRTLGERSLRGTLAQRRLAHTRRRGAGHRAPCAERQQGRGQGCGHHAAGEGQAARVARPRAPRCTLGGPRGRAASTSLRPTGPRRSARAGRRTCREGAR